MTGWPGVFRPLLHRVAEDAWSIPWGTGRVFVADCGALCWPTTPPSEHYTPCERCADFAFPAVGR